jgi:hypothetical protein
LQTGSVALHRSSFVVEHCPQAPSDRHAGVFDGHCASLWQPAQVPLATLQIGVVPLQASSLVAEHFPQSPLG